MREETKSRRQKISLWDMEEWVEKRKTDFLFLTSCFNFFSFWSDYFSVGILQLQSQIWKVGLPPKFWNFPSKHVAERHRSSSWLTKKEMTKLRLLAAERPAIATEWQVYRIWAKRGARGDLSTIRLEINVINGREAHLTTLNVDP